MHNNYYGYRNPYQFRGNGGYGGYYNPYGFYGADPYGGYLNGAANAISAQGQYLVNSQQAYLLKEQVRSSQLTNRRKAFDEYLYEKSLTPTLNDVRVKEQQEELRRALTNPPQTEIWSGKSLNDVFTHIQNLKSKGVDGSDVPLSPNTLRQINLTVKDVGNVGLLKEAGKLNWPFGLQIVTPESTSRELRQQIDSLLLEGKKQAGNTGRVDAGILVNLNKDINQLRNMLVSQVSQYSFGDYTGAKSYLRQLDEAVKILKQPDAGNYFNGKYQARGNTVAQLVQYMTENGLRFAPAVAGEEAAYSSLFQSLLQYDMGCSSMASQSGLPTPPPPAPPR